MAKKLIPEELDLLIQEFLTDGVLTEKERQVILKKAVGMGLDRDEIDLYLDAQVQKIDQVTDAAVRKRKSKACPYCGAPVPQLADKCPECGQFITPEASQDLQEIFDNLEEALINMKSRKDVEKNRALVERYARKAKLYYNNNPKIKVLIAEIDNEIITTESRIKSAKRQEKLDAITKNFIGLIFSALESPILWCIVSIIIGVLLMSSGFGTYFTDLHNGLGEESVSSLVLGGAGVLTVIGGVYGLLRIGDLTENVVDFFTNPWTYAGLFIVLSVLVIAFFGYKVATVEKEDNFGWTMGLIYGGGGCIGLTIAFIKKYCD